MTELALLAGRQIAQTADFRVNRNAWRLLLLLALAVLASLSGDYAHIVATAMSDAFLQVTVFVGATLAAVYAFERAFAVDIGDLLKAARRWQSLFAALLGAMPGCGGAIIVVTQYTRGYVTFGGVVSEIDMMATAVIGWVSGVIVDKVHGQDFMSQGGKPQLCPAFLPGRREMEEGRWRRLMERFWLALVLPGLGVGVLVAAQVDFDALIAGLGIPVFWLGVAGAALCLAMWGFSRTSHAHAESCPYLRSNMTSTTRVIKDTNFVTSWVVVGFLSYELAVHILGSGIENWLSVWAPFVPLVAIAIGFIPGCGPQIVVTSLYVTGVVPLSAQLGNSIANDGDALFPALALAPRAALLATVYSAIPAFILAYSYYFLFE
ncbi:MAG TPA: putative manganese transporter [Hyphomicrobiales bacterium]|nr:putative manganese transporter [Hyphomicrobiales bacterium]